MKVKYINNWKPVFDFKQMGLFTICIGLWFLGGLSNMIFLREELLVLLAQIVFVGFFFKIGIEKNASIWYKAYILCTSYIEKCWDDEKIIDSWPGLKTYP